MALLRPFCRHHRQIALCFSLLALALRLLVPTGYMPTPGVQGFTVTICTGMGLKTVNLSGKFDQQSPHDDGSSDRQPCAYAGLGMVATGAIALPLVIAALLFAILVGIRPKPLAVAAPAPFLRPPLRAPPALA